MVCGWYALIRRRSSARCFFFFQAEDGIRDLTVTGVQTCALPISYHHTILPLSPRRDKLTEVRWGIADFRRRFGREPEGMWLPETAVDDETLDVQIGRASCRERV